MRMTKVLLAMEDRNEAEKYARMLTERGYESMLAANQSDALQKFEQFKNPAVIIEEDNNTYHSGNVFSFIARIKNYNRDVHYNSRSLPVVLSSNDENCERYQRYDTVVYITPMGPKRKFVIDAIDEHMSSRRKEVA